MHPVSPVGSACYHESMIIRAVNNAERLQFNAAATHPLQTWEWGEFRRATGVEVERLAVFDDNSRLIEGITTTFHRVPLLGGTAGYYPKGGQPSEATLQALKTVGQKHHALFVKLEPNLMYPVNSGAYYQDVIDLIKEQGGVPGQTLFTPYTFVLDLNPGVEDLFNNCKSKTRYNIRVARKKGVEIVEDTSLQGMADYLRLLAETTARQGFYAHGPEYFQTMWQVMGESGMLRILKAVYQGKVITAWILFFLNGVGYYPYGASSREYREVMANNLMMWEALMLAKREGCSQFDMWGSLGPNPDPNHKWYGFHRFKEGYGGTLMESLGTYDLVVNPPVYQVFKVGNALRWAWLRYRARGL